MRFAVLASGSSGNACYVEAGNTRLLIDAGLSGREIERRLETVGRSAADLDALIVTHEHSDHIKGAGVLSRRFDLPVYINQKTLEMGRKILGKILRTEIVQTGQTLKIKDLDVETFTKCHDAADPVGLVLSLNGTRFGMVTDLGKSTRLVEDRLKGCQTVLVEFNHDPEMLDNGPYPLYLKRRIKSRDGHLSNEQAGDLLEAISHVKLKKVVLAHLSEQNNHPDKALKKASAVLGNCGLSQTDIVISHQHEPGPLLEVE
jgi:phosphoribosyl 1,2-cyclic phosphodiesterase